MSHIVEADLLPQSICPSSCSQPFLTQSLPKLSLKIQAHTGCGTSSSDLFMVQAFTWPLSTLTFGLLSFGLLSFGLLSSPIIALHPLRGYPGSWLLCALIFWTNFLQKLILRCFFCFLRPAFGCGSLDQPLVPGVKRNKTVHVLYYSTIHYTCQCIGVRHTERQNIFLVKIFKTVSRTARLFLAFVLCWCLPKFGGKLETVFLLYFYPTTRWTKHYYESLDTYLHPWNSSLQPTGSIFVPR